jgi:hypothetical protein
MKVSLCAQKTNLEGCLQLHYKLLRDIATYMQNARLTSYHHWLYFENLKSQIISQKINSLQRKIIFPLHLWIFKPLHMIYFRSLHQTLLKNSNKTPNQMQQSIVKFIAWSHRRCSTCFGYYYAHHQELFQTAVAASGFRIFLMMGIIMPETCWAPSMRLNNKFYDWLLHLVGCFIWILNGVSNNDVRRK